jgi:hypothetical protein
MKKISDYINDGWVKILRTGTWTDHRKRKHKFDENRLQEIENNYKSQVNFSLAPLTPTHDFQGLTDLGKIEKIKKVDQYLLAKPKKVAAEIMKILKRVGCKFISSSLNPDNTLNHVALVPNPAIKGLGEFPEAAMNFSQPEDSIELLIEFSALEEESEETHDPNHEDLKIDQKEENNMFGKEKKKKPDEEQPQEQDIKTADDSTGEKNESGEDNSDFSVAMAAAEKAKNEAAELKKKLAAMEQKQKETEVAEFCKSLKPGVILPKHQKGLEKLLVLLSEAEDTYDFSADGKGEAETPYEFARSFLSSLESQIPLDPLKVKGTIPDDDEIEFSANVDDEDLEQHKKALAIMKEKECTYEEALTRV